MGNLFKFLVATIASALLLINVTDSGTICPSRLMLYPCLCTNVPYSDKPELYTLVTCRNVASKSVLAVIFNHLRTMVIDKFILYDSFWRLEKNHPRDSDVHRNLPQNWISQLKIKELEVLDTRLSSCFACDITVGCPNLAPFRISFKNSSSSASICSTCDSELGKFSWMGCMPNLQHFEFVNNKLKLIPTEFFMVPMKELKIVNMSHNEIRVIGKEAFVNVPKMEILDLSHNMIADITNGIFGGKETVITFLDLSYNQVVTLSADIFKLNPFLVTFNMRNNLLEKLNENDWKHLSLSVATVDLTENLIECDCNMTWINRTMSMNVELLGTCITPGYGNVPLRIASDNMNEQCKTSVIVENPQNETEAEIVTGTPAP